MLALGVSAQGSPEHWIFVYDAATGTGLKKLQSGGQVSAIAFSKDDRYVAVAAWDNLTVYALPKFEPVFTDRFGDVVWGLDFDKSGRLVAGSFAGEVRVYDNQFRAIARGQTSTAKEIVGVAFSPDGSRIAIGFNYGVGIEMFSADDLAALATLKASIGVKGASNTESRVGCRWEDRIRARFHKSNRELLDELHSEMGRIRERRWQFQPRFCPSDF